MAKKIRNTGRRQEGIKNTGRRQKRISKKAFAKAIGAERIRLT